MNTIEYFDDDSDAHVKVTDKQSLRKMAEDGLIIWPVDQSGGCYVEIGGGGMSFEFCGKELHLEYEDGCFFPYVFDYGWADRYKEA